MEPVASRLPAAFGSTAALVVAGISLLVQASPITCLMRAIAAFVVFSAFGIVIRYLLADAAGQMRMAGRGGREEENGVDGIMPGTMVDELLMEEE